MEDIIIIGAGGFAREVAWMLEENNKRMPQWNILGFVSKDAAMPNCKYPVLGDDEWLLQYDKKVNIACSIGNGSLRRKIMEQYKEKQNFCYPNLISKDAVCTDEVRMGKGNIICAGSILTVNIELGDFIICNLDCTIGHDAVLKDYVTLNPSVNISGNVSLDEEVTVGTGCNIIQGIHVDAKATIGAGAVVVSDLQKGCTAVGVPARMIKV